MLISRSISSRFCSKLFTVAIIRCTHKKQSLYTSTSTDKQNSYAILWYFNISWCSWQSSSHLPHRAENTEWASDAQVNTTECDHLPCSGAPIWLKWLVWQHCLLSVLVFVWQLKVNWRKQDLQDMWSDAEQKNNKRKKKKLPFQGNYDTSWHDCAITSFSGFAQNQPFLLRCYVLCAQQQSFAIFLIS